MVTPQTNTTLKAIAEALRERDNFVICGHVGPDGDCLGSQLTLLHALRALGKTASVVLAKDEPIGQDFLFLPGADEFVPAANFDGVCDTFVAVDVPTPERIGEAANALREAARFRVTIDHHAVETCMADLNYVDPDSASASMMLWEVAGYLGECTADMATCAYTGLMTDTGRFAFQNADARAFAAAAEMVKAGADPAAISTALYQQRRLASLLLQEKAISRMRFALNGQVVLSYLKAEDFEAANAEKSDAEPLIDLLRSLRGVRVACMLRDQGQPEIRGSFRAKDDTDVARIARMLGGGGHTAAAGFSVDGPVEGAVDMVFDLLQTELAAAWN